MTVIVLQNVTKDYGHGRGIFNVSIDVKKGTVYGFLGPNGAGKTTAIRHIMGFSKPQKGHVSVNGLDSWNEASVIQNRLGYLPGEVALPEHVTGKQFINMMMQLKKVTDETHCQKLIDFFELDVAGKVKKMSLGTKRKLAIVTAFMHDPDVLVLDEPTSGLDPMMQERFIEFILQEKKRGKTILLSSHIFPEIDATCDEISIIKDGYIMTSFNKKELLSMTNKVFQLTATNQQGFQELLSIVAANKDFHCLQIEEEKLMLQVGCIPHKLTHLIKLLKDIPLARMTEIPFSLEKYFMEYYDRHLGGEVT